MTKRLGRCITCKPDEAASDPHNITKPGKRRRRGWTRHKNRICGLCRKESRLGLKTLPRVRDNVS